MKNVGSKCNFITNMCWIDDLIRNLCKIVFWEHFNCRSVSASYDAYGISHFKCRLIIGSAPFILSCTKPNIAHVVGKFSFETQRTRWLPYTKHLITWEAPVILNQSLVHFLVHKEEYDVMNWISA